MSNEFVYITFCNFDIIYKANGNDVDYAEEPNLNLDLKKSNYIFKEEVSPLDDHIISFDTYIYIVELINSYKKSTNIVQQFNIDYDRHQLYLNGYTYNIDNFKYYMKQLLNKHGYDNFKIMTLSCELFIMLLCCQSSFAYPYQLLVKLYKLDGNNGLFLTSNKKKSNLKITINNHDINIELITYLQITNVDNLTIDSNISVTLIFVINKSDEFVPNYIPSSIFTWNKE